MFLCLHYSGCMVKLQAVYFTLYTVFKGGFYPSVNMAKAKKKFSVLTEAEQKFANKFCPKFGDSGDSSDTATDTKQTKQDTELSELREQCQKLKSRIAELETQLANRKSDSADAKNHAKRPKDGISMLPPNLQGYARKYAPK